MTDHCSSHIYLFVKDRTFMLLTHNVLGDPVRIEFQTAAPYSFLMGCSSKLVQFDNV